MIVVVHALSRREGGHIKDFSRRENGNGGERSSRDIKREVLGNGYGGWGVNPPT